MSTTVQPIAPESEEELEADKLCRKAILQDLGVIPVDGTPSGDHWKAAAEQGSSWAQMKLAEESWRSEGPSNQSQGDAYGAAASEQKSPPPSMKVEAFKAQKEINDKKFADNVILVIDDDRNLTELIEESLSDPKYVIKAVHTPNKALSFIREEPRIFAVLLDYDMPNANGFQLLQTIRTNNLAKKSVCFIMLTGFSDPGLIKQGAKLGIRRWLVKPFDPSGIKDLVDRVYKGAKV